MKCDPNNEHSYWNKLIDYSISNQQIFPKSTIRTLWSTVKIAHVDTKTIGRVNLTPFRIFILQALKLSFLQKIWIRTDTSLEYPSNLKKCIVPILLQNRK